MKPLYLVGQDAPLSKLPKSFPKKIDESLSLGIDIGIGSCGTALVHEKLDGKPVIRGFESAPEKIVFMGVRTFDVPETKEQTGPKLKNPERRQKRLLRRVTQRRAKRMRQVRYLFQKQGLLPKDYHPLADDWKLRHEAALPWQWRVEALERALTPWEWGSVLMYFAKHRGFRSNRKSDLESKGKTGGTLESAKANHEALEHYRTLGEMFVSDSRFAERKRNRDGVYTSMIQRADLIKEIEQLFDSQTKCGNAHSTPVLKNAYLEILEFQNPLQDPVSLLDNCPFEPAEKRGCRLSPSFELSRALQKLNAITLTFPGNKRVRLSDFANAKEGGYAPFLAFFGSKKAISWKDLRNLFSIPDDATFDDLSVRRKTSKKPTSRGSAAKATESDEISVAEQEKQDFVTSSNSKSCAEGTALLRKALGPQLWNQCTNQFQELLDHAAFCLSFYELVEDPTTDCTILGQISQHCAACPDLIAAIRQDLTSEKPTLHRFSGSCSLSTLASRKILPHLMNGLVYSDAVIAIYGDHRQSDYQISKITNPIVASVVRETVKQIVHLIDETGALPGRINLELARDLGKSIDERNEIAAGIKKRTEAKNSTRAFVAELLGCDTDRVSAEELLRYELYYEQGGICPYSGESLPEPARIFTAELQIDHVLPRSRSHDNGYDNKVLVYTHANQNKGSLTPFEWLGGPDSQSWSEFCTRIAGMKSLRRRKRVSLLDATFATREAEFAERNLNDTRYIGRLVLAYLEDIYRIAGEEPGAKGSTRRVFVRPGALTSMVRKAWGLEDLKKDRNGRRLGDKHHAVDALICACLGEGSAQWIARIGKAWRDMEKRHDSHLALRGLTPPWKTFREDVVKALDSFSVSRRERCHGRGALHADTIYRWEEDEKGNGVAWQRVSLINIENGKKKARFTGNEQLENIKGIQHPKNQWLRTALETWIANGSPVDAIPVDPQGCQIRKVFVRSAKASLRKIPQGYVTNGDLVRCDVFSKAGKYYLVPVYAYHLAYVEPPMRAIVADKEESAWDLIDDSYGFEFSLWKNSRFRVEKKAKRGADSGEFIEGNYLSIDRNTARISYADPEDSQTQDRASVKQGCTSFIKYHVDRLGRMHQVKREVRTWRGGVCT